MSTPDRIFWAVGGTNPLGQQTPGDLLPEPGTIDDTAKISNCAYGSVMLGHVRGGAEDCVDVNNHCREIIIHAKLWEPTGQYLATIKGGSSNITLSGVVRGHGTVTDVDIGNYSDQSDNSTGPVFLKLVHELGPQEPIQVRRLNGMDPILLNGETQKYVICRAIPGDLRSLWAKVFAVLKKLRWV